MRKSQQVHDIIDNNKNDTKRPKFSRRRSHDSRRVTGRSVLKDVQASRREGQWRLSKRLRALVVGFVKNSLTTDTDGFLRRQGVSSRGVAQLGSPGTGTGAKELPRNKAGNRAGRATGWLPEAGNFSKCPRIVLAWCQGAGQCANWHLQACWGIFSPRRDGFSRAG
jgi:hypothetical protein